MNYIGSKYSLLPFLESVIDNSTKLTAKSNLIFADLFAGTGIIGATYRSKGWKVISNDLQYYSYVLNRHYISNSEPENKNLLVYLNSLEGEKGFIYYNYCLASGSGRNYFTEYNAKKCDAIRIKLEKLYSLNKISEETYYYF